MTWLWLALWAPATFLLHCALHEGAHAVAVRRLGGRITAVQLYPHREPDGRFVWASINWMWITATPARLVVAYAAPLLVELVWMVLALAVAQAWRWSALEAFAAALDVGTWCLGLATRRVGTDAWRVLGALK